MAVPNFSDAIIDGGPDAFGSLVTRVDVCTTEPTTHTEATATYSLGNYVLAPGDWSVANGDTSGRKAIMAQQTGSNSTGTGAANFLAYTQTVGTLLHGVINADGDSITSGNPLTLQAVDAAEFRDPT